MKKLTVCGKGGSGKSTIVVLLANEMRRRGYHVLVVDSDESNSGLYRMLGFDEAPVPLMELVGGRKGVKQRMSPKVTIGEAEPQMTILGQDEIWLTDIPSEHMLSRDGISLVSIGKISKSLEGCACPMGVLSREFLKKLCLKDNEMTIVDMEAGVEHFGRGVETSIDGVLIVVDPSFESLEIAQRIRGLAAGSGVDGVWAVLNKINSGELFSRLETELGKRDVAVLGSISYDAEVFEACLEGRPLHSKRAMEETGKLLDALLQNEIFLGAES